MSDLDISGFVGIAESITTIESEAKDVRNLMVLESFNSLSRESPVDTGWFRANWIFSGAESAKGKAAAVGGLDVPDKPGHASVGAAQSQSTGVNLDKVPMKGEVWLWNNATYAEFLNDRGGKSKWQPGNFQATIERVVREIGGSG